MLLTNRQVCRKMYLATCNWCTWRALQVRPLLLPGFHLSMSKAHGPCCIPNDDIDHLLSFRETRSFPATITWCVLCAVCCGPIRLQQYARDARKEYAELGSKDLSELKSFVKGLPKLLLLDRLSDLAVPVAEVVKQQVRAHLQAVGWDRP